MFRKSFAFILLLVLTGATTLAQTTPESKEKKEKKGKIATKVNMNRAFNLAFGGGGSYLGVHMQEVTSDNFSKYGLSDVRGVAITKIAEDSPAAKAGLKDKDVVVRFNGESVTSVRKLRRLISEVAPDHNAKVTVMRNGTERDIDVKMGKSRGAIFSRGGNFTTNVSPNIVIPRMPRMPRGMRVPNVRISPNIASSVFTLASSRSIGVRLTPLSKQLGEFMGVADGHGMLVNHVSKDSPAAKAGLKAGDVIVEADGKKVKRTMDLLRALGKKKEGDVELKIVRDKQSRTIKVTPEKSKGGANFFFRDSDGDFTFDTDHLIFDFDENN